MQLFWFYFQYTLITVACFSSRLLYNKSHWIAFVKQTELSLWICCGCRVKENSSCQKIPMYVGHHRSDIPGDIRSLCRSVGLLTVLNIIFYTLWKMHIITFINGI